jgi:hypothetical protein
MHLIAIKLARCSSFVWPQVSSLSQVSWRFRTFHRFRTLRGFQIKNKQKRENVIMSVKLRAPVTIDGWLSHRNDAGFFAISNRSVCNKRRSSTKWNLNSFMCLLRTCGKNTWVRHPWNDFNWSLSSFTEQSSPDDAYNCFDMNFTRIDQFCTFATLTLVSLTF